LLRTEGHVEGIPLTYFGYYYGGLAGTNGAKSFDEYRKDFEDFLNGLREQQ